MKFLKSLNEYYTLAIAIIIFWLSPMLFRSIDPTAGAFDLGVLQAPILGIVKFCILQAFVWITIKTVWPDIATFYSIYFFTSFKFLTSWQKLIFSLALYLALFFFLVVLSIA